MTGLILKFIPDAKETMLEYKSEHIPFGFPTTYFIKNGELGEFPFGYVAIYGNPKPAESNSYFHIKEILDRLLPGDFIYLMVPVIGVLKFV